MQTVKNWMCYNFSVFWRHVAYKLKYLGIFKINILVNIETIPNEFNCRLNFMITNWIILKIAHVLLNDQPTISKAKIKMIKLFDTVKILTPLTLKQDESVVGC